MKAVIIRATIFALGLFALLSCNQGPIFYMIHKETPPLEPIISGAPTNMVVFEREYSGVTVPILYVASGRIHWYAIGTDNKSRWNSGEYSIPQPGGRVIALAATEDYLYALCQTGHNVDAVLRRLGKDSTNDETNGWEIVPSPGYSKIQSIYADPEYSRVFAGVRTAGSSSDTDQYAILYLNTEDPSSPILKLLRNDTSLLSGAISDGTIYYLSTREKGIFEVADSDLDTDDTSSVEPLGNDDDKKRRFMGMIKLDDPASTIIAVERVGGALFEVSAGSITKISLSTGSYATGALALWTDGSNKSLVAGIQGGLWNTTTSAYTYGYVEFDLAGDGAIDQTSSRRDPGNLRSVRDNDNYKSTIGTKPLNHLFQAPLDIDDKMTFFASTQNSGLWSYKDRPNSGGWQWNAEN